MFGALSVDFNCLVHDYQHDFPGNYFYLILLININNYMHYTRIIIFRKVTPNHTPNIATDNPFSPDEESTTVSNNFIKSFRGRSNG